MRNFLISLALLFTLVACDEDDTVRYDLTTVQAGVTMATAVCARVVECGGQSTDTAINRCETYAFLDACGEGETDRCNEIFSVTVDAMDRCLADLAELDCRDVFDNVRPESCRNLF